MTWIQVGYKRADLFYPHPSVITIGNVAASLSRIPRFVGHTQTNWSVASHSLFVSQIVQDLGGSKLAQMVGLLHDASEMFTGDIPSPLKETLLVMIDEELHPFTNYEDELLSCVFRSLMWSQLTERPLVDEWNLVKKADLIALASEKAEFLPPSPEPWKCLEGVEAVPLSPNLKVFFNHTAAIRYESAYHTLMEELC